MPDVLALFDGILLLTHRELIAHLLLGNLIAMAKANAEATAVRVDLFQEMILAGEPNTLCLSFYEINMVGIPQHRGTVC